MQLHTPFYTDKVHIVTCVAIGGQLCFPDGEFLDVNHTQLCETAHWPLLRLIMWYGDKWICL